MPGTGVCHAYSNLSRKSISHFNACHWSVPMPGTGVWCRTGVWCLERIGDRFAGRCGRGVHVTALCRPQNDTAARRSNPQSGGAKTSSRQRFDGPKSTNASETLGPGFGGERIRYVISRDDGKTWNEHFEYYNPRRAINGRTCPRTVQLNAETVGVVFYDIDVSQEGGPGSFFLAIPLAELAN